MTCYMGGKFFMCGAISEIIREKKTPEQTIYVEPFCGMCSVGLKLMGMNLFDEYRFSDVNEEVIMFWKAIQSGWIPKACVKSIDDYESWRYCPSCPQKTFIGYVYALRSVFFDKCILLVPTSRRSGCKPGRPLILKRLRDTQKLIQAHKVSFQVQSYTDIVPTENMTIYCDPPYLMSNKSSRISKFLTEFNHDEFWNQMETWAGISWVYVSECDAPDGWKRIYSRRLFSPFMDVRKKERVDSLWV